LLLFLQLFLSSSCSSDDFDDSSSIKVSEPTYPEKIYEFVDIDSLDSLYVSNFCIFKKYLFLQVNSPFPKFYLVDLEHKKLIKTFGEKGGPYRFNNPNCFCQMSIEIKEGREEISVLLNDKKMGLLKLFLWSENEDGKFVTTRIETPEDISPAVFYLSNDSKRVFGYDPSRESVYNYDILEHRTLLKPGGFIKSTKLDVNMAANVYGSAYSLDNSRELFAVAYYFFNKIDIYGSDLNLRKTLSIGDLKNEIPKMRDGFVEEHNVFYFGLVHLTNKNLYTFYLDKQYKDVGDIDFSKFQIINLSNLSIKGFKVPFNIQWFIKNLSGNSAKIQ
jgi:hypothetical protein